MFFEAVNVNNFRNLTTQSINFNKKINLIIGENAQGKTSLLELIYFLIQGRSFKEKTDANLINWNKQECLIKATVCDDSRSLEPSALIKLEKTSFHIDGKIKKTKGIASYEPVSVVVFLPEDLELIKGSPDNRRNYLDNIFSNIWIKQKVNRINYFKTLKQRNFFLKGGASKGLKIWDRQLAKFGSTLLSKRLETLEGLSEIMKTIHKQLVSENDEIRFSYKPSFHLSDFKNVASIEEDFLQGLQNTREADLKYQTTTIGPHKDDIQIFLNNKNSREFGSQGQQRTLAITLRVGEWEMYKREIGLNSILLLDDIFSELDQRRRSNLLNFIADKEQTFITSVNSDFFREKTFSSVNVLKAEKGTFYGQA